MESLDDESLKEKEEHYRRLNESLKQKTASLISQAENALKEQTKTCASFDLSPGRGDGGKRMKMKQYACPEDKTRLIPDNLSTSNEKGLAHDTYQGRLNEGKHPDMPEEYSSSDESLIEEFDKLHAHPDEATSTSSVVSKGMSVTAQARLYQAKLRVAKMEIKRLKAQCEKLAKENTLLTDKSKKSENDHQKAMAGSAKHNSEVSKLKKALDEESNEIQQVKLECSTWKKTAENASRESQSMLSSKTQLEVKLRRAGEDIEKLRKTLETEKERMIETENSSKEKVLSLETSNKKLEKQKQELIVGFKKQMKLIDVLKRQKMHLEGAKLLQISEEEFLKVIDLNLNE